MASPTQARAFALVAGERPSHQGLCRPHDSCRPGQCGNRCPSYSFACPPPRSRRSIRSSSERSSLSRPLPWPVSQQLVIIGATPRVPSPSTRAFPSAALRSCNAEAWVWVPAFALLSRQDSLFSAALSALSAALLAIGLRRTLPQFNDDRNPQPPALRSRNMKSFPRSSKRLPAKRTDTSSHLRST